MNISKLPRILSALTAASLVSCSSVSVKTDADPQANFAKYRTYALSPSPAPGSRTLSPTSFATLQSTLNSGLAAKGIQEASKPSFVVAYHVAAKNRTEVFMVPNWGYYGGYGRGHYGYWPAYGTTQPMVSQFTEGTLVLNFVDTTTNRLIWRGTAVGIIGSQKENQESITEAVRKMLEDFPPKR